MSYEKINFKNREVEKPLTFKKHVNDDGTITLEPKPGTIVEPGTPLLADHFNHMDNGIYKAHEEIDNLKLSGIERNKELVANLNSKKVSATTNDSLKTNIAKVKDIKLGSGNAVTSDVLEGKTFSSSHGTDLTGAMPNHGELTKTLTTQNGKQIITPGYYEGGEVKAQFNNLIPRNIRKGINIGGVVGNAEARIVKETGNYIYDNGKVIARGLGITPVIIKTKEKDGSHSRYDISSEYIYFTNYDGAKREYRLDGERYYVKNGEFCIYGTTSGGTYECYGIIL